MTWTRPVASFAQGAAITLGSTAVSCALALQVEQSAHRFFFWCAPHWYARIDQAYGLTAEDLQYARQAAGQRDLEQVSNLARHVAFWDTAVVAGEDTTLPTTTLRSTPRWWNTVRTPSDEEGILESAPL